MNPHYGTIITELNRLSPVATLGVQLSVSLHADSYQRIIIFVRVNYSLPCRIKTKICLVHQLFVESAIHTIADCRSRCLLCLLPFKELVKDGVFLINHGIYCQPFSLNGIAIKLSTVKINYLLETVFTSILRVSGCSR